MLVQTCKEGIIHRFLVDWWESAGSVVSSGQTPSMKDKLRDYERSVMSVRASDTD